MSGTDTTYFIPLRDALPFWPTDRFTSRDEDGFLDRVGLSDFEAEETPTQTTLRLTVAFRDEIEFDLPGLDGFAFVFGADADGGGSHVTVEIDVRPPVEVRFVDASVTLRMDQDVVRPVEQTPDGTWTPVLDADGEQTPFELALTGIDLAVGADGSVSLDGQTTLAAPSFTVGDSGVVVEPDQPVSVHLSDDQTPPPGQSVGWRGVHIAGASIHLPEFDFPAAPSGLAFEDCYIGSGGFSGSVSATWSGDDARGELFGMTFALRAVDLSFVQNTPTAMGVRGVLTLPYFDQPLGVDVSVGTDGSFAIGLSAHQPPDVTHDGGLVSFEIEDVLRFTVESLRFEREQDRFVVTVGGDVEPAFDGADGWPGVSVKALSVDSDGNVHVEGGWLDLRDQYSVDFYGFTFEVTKLGFGSNDDGSRWLGLNGGLKFVDEFAAGVSVEGLRITWDDGGFRGISFDGVGVEFEVPDAIRFKGAISYRKLGDQHRFDGDVELDLPALDLSIDATLVVGTDVRDGEEYTFFAIYLGVELPRGIPLWSSGLALYGFAGLYAQNMVPNKGRAGHENEDWYDVSGESWYHRDELGVTDLKNKWDPERGGFALGAGVTLGTAPDNGFAFSGRLLLVISFPGPVVMLQGRANLLTERSKLAQGEPLFGALAVLDANAGTFQLGLDAKYKQDDEGRLVDIGASAEAFYDFTDPLAWYVHVGEKEPRENRVRAKFLSLFQADSYLMLNPRQLAFGGRVGYDAHYGFGPLGVDVEAWIESNVLLNFFPPHFYGDLWLHAHVALRAFGFSIGLTADARLAADVYDPFHVVGDFRVKLNLPWPLPDPKATIRLEWGPKLEAPPIPHPLKEVSLEHQKSTVSWPLPRDAAPKPDDPGSYDPLLTPDYGHPDLPGMLKPRSSRDTPLPAPDASAPPPSELPVVPVDARPQLTFNRPVHDRSDVGEYAHEIEPPVEVLGDPATGEGPVTVEYALEDVRLSKWMSDGSGWQPAGTDLYGSWAPMPRVSQAGADQLPGSDAAKTNTKLWLQSKNPFDFARGTGGAWIEGFGYQFPGYPCPVEDACYDFDDLTIKDFTVTDTVETETIDYGEEVETVTRYRYDVRRDVAWPGFSYVHERDAPAPDVGGSPAGPALRCRSGFPSTAVTVTLPFHTRSASVTVGVGGGTEQVLVRAHAADGTTLEEHWTPTRINHRTFTFTSDDADIVELWLRANGVPGQIGADVAIAEVCVADYDLSGGVGGSERVEALQQAVDRWTGEDFVFEPYTTYRLEIDTAAVAEGQGELGDYTRDEHLAEYAYFRTGGPPGLAELSLPIGTPEPDSFDTGLDDLTRYVEQTTPPTVPRPGEKPRLPRPVYRAYDVGVIFDENYIDLAYRMGGRDLALYLFDANDRPVRDARGRLVVVEDAWGDPGEQLLDRFQRRWVETVLESDCIDIDAETIERTDTLETALTTAPQVLDADSNYEVRLRPVLVRETFADGDAGWDATGGAWSVAHHDLFEGDAATVQSPGTETTMELDGFTAFASLIDGATVVTYDADTARPGGTYVVVGTDPSAGTVTVDGEPVFPGGSSTWEIPARGRLHGSAGSGGATLAYAGRLDYPADDPTRPDAWRDCRVAASLRATDPGSEVGVSFRGTTGDHLRALLDYGDNTCRLQRVEDGTATDLATADHDLTVGQSYRLAVESVGTTHRVYLDGDPVVAADADAGAGGVGLYCRDGGLDCDEVRVDDVRGKAPDPYRFAFTTSMFATFLHHLHSYQDETWQATVADDVGSGFAEAVPPTDSPTGDEAHQYEQLVDDLAVPSSVDRVEVTRIETDDGTPRALLVQSPEPIRWQHTDLELRRAATGTSLATPGDVKLVDATLDSDERVTLLCRNASDLSNWTVEHRQPSVEAGNEILLDEAFATPDDWTFVDEPPYSTRSSNWEFDDGGLRQTSNIYGFVGGPYRQPGTYGVIGDDTWTDYRLAIHVHSADNDAIGVLFRYQDSENFYRFAMDDEREYRRLTRTVNGETTLLWADDGPFETGRDYELTVACLGPQLVGFLDGDLVFDVVDEHLASGKVGVYCRANTGARFANLRVTSVGYRWTPYYEFGSEQLLPAGTRVRVHAGPAGQSTPGVEQRVLDADGSVPPLPSSLGATLRLRTPDGTIAHERSFRPDGDYNLVTPRVIRKADGTGFIITAGDPLPDGQYRLVLTYHRGDDGNSQGGNIDPERATLDIPWNTK